MALKFLKRHIHCEEGATPVLEALSSDKRHYFTSSIPGIIFHYVDDDLVYVGNTVFNTEQELKKVMKTLYRSWE